MPPKSHTHSFFLWLQNRGGRDRRSHRCIMDKVTLAPLGYGFRIDTIPLRQNIQALLTMLYRSTHRLCRAGASRQNLSHNSSFRSCSCITPAYRGTKHAKTVAKWKKRTFVHDAPMGPKEPASTVLTKEEEAMCVVFRQHTLLPLDDCLYALQPTIPHLSRSTLHRCYQRHGISRLPDIEGDKSAKKKFKKYSIGYFHLDIAEVRTEEGKLYLFVAIDRTSKFAYVELHDKSNRNVSTVFLRNLINAVPYKIHTILTDNGSQFCHPPRYRNGTTAQQHSGSRICSTCAVTSTALSTGSQNQNILGRTDRSNA